MAGGEDLYQKEEKEPVREYKMINHLTLLNG
jgi:hypothetical protein